ncbi:MAG: hypothetical protein P8M61_01775 [Crocinitomicaceae bacterium]|nr:hypothetical protein [Crocinitomicaceae bacterium]
MNSFYPLSSSSMFFLSRLITQKLLNMTQMAMLQKTIGVVNCQEALSMNTMDLEIGQKE